MDALASQALQGVGSNQAAQQAQAGEQVPAQTPVVTTAPISTPVPLAESPVTEPSYANVSDPGGPQYPQGLQKPLETQLGRFNSGEEGENLVKPSRWQQWSAGWDLTSHGSPIGLPGSSEIGAIPRWFNERSVQNYSDENSGPVLTADQANKMFPGRPEPYAAPVSQMVAQMEYNDRQRIQRLQEWKSAGGETPFTDFSQGILGGFADPLNLAISSIAGPLSKGLLGEAETFGGKIAARYAENLGVNAATGGVTYAVEKSEGEKPSLYEYAKQSAEGALGGTLFHTLLVDPLARAFESFKNESPATRERITREVVSSMDRNTTPDLSAQDEVREQRKAGAIDNGTNVRRIVPNVDNPTQYYAGVDSAGNRTVFQDGLGEGSQLHSNPDRVNNSVSDPEGGKPGKIAETKLPDKSSLLDLDKPFPKELIDQAQAELRKAGLGDLVARSELEQMPGKDVLKAMDALPPLDENLTPSDLMRARADAEGYTGYTMLDKTPDGSPVGRIAHVFDKNHPITGDVFQANSEVTPKVSEDRQAQLDTAQNEKSASTYSTPEIDKEVHDLRHGDALNSTPDYMDPYVQDIEDHAKEQLQRLSETSDSAKDALDELRRMTADGKQEANVAKMLGDCMEGNAI